MLVRAGFLFKAFRLGSVLFLLLSASASQGSFYVEPSAEGNFIKWNTQRNYPTSDNTLLGNGQSYSYGAGVGYIWKALSVGLRYRHSEITAWKYQAALASEDDGWREVQGSADGYAFQLGLWDVGKWLTLKLSYYYDDKLALKLDPDPNPALKPPSYSGTAVGVEVSVGIYSHLNLGGSALRHTFSKMKMGENETSLPGYIGDISHQPLYVDEYSVFVSFPFEFGQKK